MTSTTFERPTVRPIGAQFGRVVALRNLWRRRWTDRRNLRRLMAAGPYLLADIGLSGAAARREIAKPFWVA